MHCAYAGRTGDSNKENTNVTQQESQKQLFTAFLSSQREFGGKQTDSHISFLLLKKNALNLSLNVLKPLLFIVQELQSVTRADIVNKSNNLANYQSVFKNVRESATSVHKRENVE